MKEWSFKNTHFRKSGTDLCNKDLPLQIMLPIPYINWWDTRLWFAIVFCSTLAGLSSFSRRCLPLNARVFSSAIAPAVVLLVWWLSTYIFHQPIMKDQDFGVHEILTEDIYLAFGTGFCVSGLRDSFGLSRTAGIISGVI